LILFFCIQGQQHSSRLRQSFMSCPNGELVILLLMFVVLHYLDACDTTIKGSISYRAEIVLYFKALCRVWHLGLFLFSKMLIKLCLSFMRKKLKTSAMNWQNVKYRNIITTGNNVTRTQNKLLDILIQCMINCASSL